MHTILGAGGPVANVLQQELEALQQPVTLVSRKPITVTGNTRWVKADLLRYDELSAAVKGSSVIYLCAGLQYNKRIWQQQWPVIMQNVISAAKINNARLIFFDNVYMYGRVQGSMTENTPYHPSSIKGEIRAGIADMLMRETKTGLLRASILRAADFYGAKGSRNSFFDAMVLENYARKKTAQWIGNVNAKHSLTLVSDAGKALFLLGQTPASDNQVWHAPTAPALTGKQLLELAAGVFQTKASHMKVNRLMLRVMGLFNTIINEVVEMYYQNRYDYVFDSSKFEQYFNYTPVSYQDGLQELRKNFLQQ